MAQILCAICSNKPKKYKCTTCSVQYCSIPCLSTHKPLCTISDDTPKLATQVPRNENPVQQPSATESQIKALLTSQPTLRARLKALCDLSEQPAAKKHKQSGYELAINELDQIRVRGEIMGGTTGRERRKLESEDAVDCGDGVRDFAALVLGPDKYDAN